MDEVPLPPSRFRKCCGRIKESGRFLCMQRRVAIVLALGFAAGFLGGLLAHFITCLQGVWAFAIAGGVLGMAIAACWPLSDRSRRFLSLTEMKITVPQLSEMTFSMNRE